MFLCFSDVYQPGWCNFVIVFFSSHQSGKFMRNIDFVTQTNVLED